ncbi:MAG: oligosaccharide flippase family protein [Chloroflexota bacterium]|nr:oligosaccharide flippase family protein [Chloroflexota bacterium]
MTADRAEQSPRGAACAPGPRPQPLRRMLGESAVYGLGGVANQTLAIVLVPIYARQLGVADFGTVAILTTTLSLATLVATAALPQAFFRAYLKDAHDDLERDAALRTALGLRLIISTFALLAFTALSLPLASALIGSTSAWLLVALIGPILFFDTLNLVPLSLLRARRRPRPYAALSFSRAVLGSVLIVLFVVVLDLGVLGVVMGSLGASIVAAVLGMLVLAGERRPAPGLDRRLAGRMLAFSLPLVPASVAGWTLNLSDRYLVQAFEGREAVGLYSAGYTVGLAINALAVAPFTLAWGAAYWEIARQADARQVIARVLTAFALLASFLALGLAALGTDAIRILLTPAFEPARFITPFSAFAYVLYGIFTIVSTGLNLESQTRRVPIILGGAAIGSVLLNLVLIPVLGYLGAAVSTLVSYAVLALAAGMVSQRFYRVPWEIGRVTASLALGMTLAAAALLGPDHVAWRLACLVAYPLLAVALRIGSVRRLRPVLAFLSRR